MSLMLPGHCRVALLIAACAAADLPVFAQTTAAPGSPSASASASGAGDAAPSERAKRDAEKVFHWIMIQGDRTRKTTTSPAQAKEDRPAAPSKTAARASPVRAAPDPVPEGVLRPKPEALAAASAPGGAETRTLVEAATTPAASTVAAGVGAQRMKPGEATAKPARTETSPPPAAAPPIEAPVDGPVALVPIAQPEPQFPAAVMRALRRGAVQVRFSVLADGSVADLEVLHTSNPRLNAAVLAAVGQWRFQPVTRVQTGAVEVGFNLD
jgi:TonB family protein